MFIRLANVPVRPNAPGHNRGLTKETIMNLTKEQILEAMKANPELRQSVLNGAKRKTADIGNGLGIAVSDKGGVSVYGNQRFPTTLYKEQWERLLASAPAILSFINVNASKLTTKPVKDK